MRYQLRFEALTEGKPVLVLPDDASVELLMVVPPSGYSVSPTAGVILREPVPSRKAGKAAKEGERHG